MKAMNLLQKLKAAVTPRKKYVVKGHKERESIDLPAPVMPVSNPPKKHKGRPGGFRKTKSATWTYNQKRRGGRAVKHIPRQLEKMKEGQESGTDSVG
jgi:hypothetical protein